MIKGVTSTGFEFKISDAATNDYEILELLGELDDGHAEKIPKIVNKLLGEEQKTKLLDHVRNPDGRVPMDKMVAELQEILRFNEETKN